MKLSPTDLLLVFPGSMACLVPEGGVIFTSKWREEMAQFVMGLWPGAQWLLGIGCAVPTIHVHYGHDKKPPLVGSIRCNKVN